MRYFNVYIDKVKGVYTYRDETNSFNVGEFVYIGFGVKKEIGLVIYEISEKPNFELKPILSHVENSLSFPQKYISFLLWVESYYCCGFNYVYNCAIPKEIVVPQKTLYTLNEDKLFEKFTLDPIILFFQKKMMCTKATLIKYFDKTLIYKIIHDEILLKENNFYKINYELYKKLKNNLNFEEKKVIEYILRKACLSKETLNKYFFKLWEKYKKDNIIIEKKEISDKKELTAEKHTEILKLLKENILTEEQNKIFVDIHNSQEKYFYIYGITGSGKTEIYIKLIKEALNHNQGSIFLVPEISLTPQLVSRFLKVFGENIAIFHSKLSPSEKKKYWLDVYFGKKKIVMGVRSAIFLPVKNLKYIIIDEEHENTYKQDTNPRYNAVSLGMYRANKENLKLVLGSATPKIENYYFGKNGIMQLYKLTNRYNNAVLPEIEIVDMKKEENLYFSKELLKNIKNTLIKEEQVMLFLNRKGFSTFVQCRDCGYVEECPHCSIKMIYYSKENKYKCNYCGYEKKFINKCQNCGSSNLQFSGKGVERIEDELKKYFDVPTIVVDSEHAKEKNYYQNAYQDFAQKKYKIMIGTQVIAKGLHFPDVTLVGVINADTILNFPDFRAGEKTFQVITQVAGRAGRGTKNGTVIVQTYMAEHFIFDRIKNNDYDGFYKKEIENRKILEYPPFSKTINIVISSTKEEGLDIFCREFKEYICDENVIILGPMKCGIYKIKDRFRYNMFVKGKKENINKFKKNLRQKIKKYDKIDKRIIVDVDPINML